MESGDDSVDQLSPNDLDSAGEPVEGVPRADGEKQSGEKQSTGRFGCLWFALVVTFLLLFYATILFFTTKDEWGSSKGERISETENNPFGVGDRSPSQGVVSESKSTTTATATNARTREKLTLPELAKRTRPSVFQVISKDSDGNTTSTGSGFFVDPNGLFVTNRHVVEEAHTVEVKEEKGGRFEVSGVLVFDSPKDLVLLKVVGFGFEPLALAETDKAIVGESIAVIGNPLGLEGTLSEGIVSAVRPESAEVYGGMVQITAPISSGSSGSPVVNDEGAVIGVATLSASLGQNLNFAVPIQYVKEMLDQFTAGDGKAVPVEAVFSDRFFIERREMKGDSLYEKCLSEFEQDQWIALYSSTTILELKYPNNALATFLAGYALFRMKDFKQEVAKRKRLVELRPKEPDFWAIYAASLIKCQNISEAVDAGLKAIELDQESWFGWGTTSVAFRLSGMFERAKDAAEICVNINPKSSDGWRALGQAQMELQLETDAMNSFLRALEINEASDDVWQAIGELHSRSGRLPEAESALRKSIELNPSADGAMALLVDVLTGQRKFDEAFDFATKAVLLDAKHVGLTARVVAARSGDVSSIVESFPETRNDSTAEENASELFDDRNREAVLRGMASRVALVYLRLGDSDSPSGQGATFYPEMIDYFTEGVIPKEKALEIERKYESQWTVRRHIPLYEPQVLDSEKGSYEVQVTSVFALSDNKKFKRMEVTTGFLIAVEPHSKILSVRTLAAESKAISKLEFRGLINKIDRAWKENPPVQMDR